jgi:hypothetical protein
MKRGQGKRWWDFGSCTIKRRKEDTRSLHRKIFSLFLFSFCFFVLYVFKVPFQRASEQGMAFRLGHYKVCKYSFSLVLAAAQNELRGGIDGWRGMEW